MNGSYSDRPGGVFLIVGLGNPENRYAATRHNTGFLCVDRIADKYGIDIKKAEGHALTGSGRLPSGRVLLAKPQTYMNASGESVQALVSYYRVDPSRELLVIVDDIHLPVGTIRIRTGGSAGGHNGLKDIIRLLGTDAFPRMRIGIGESGAERGLIPHVLGNFSGEEWPLMNETLDRAAEAADCFLTDGIQTAMNRFNASGRTDKGETGAGD